MELRTIDTFLKVASTQNLSKAAEQLGYTQSAVTIQIQKLEKELGIELFERIGKHIYLTDKGKDFIFYANKIMQDAESALAFSKEETSPKGKLRIGGVESICTGLLPDLLIEFHKICPNVEVIIKSGASSALLEMAASNEIDLIFTMDHKIYKKEWVCAIEKQEDIIFVTLAKNKKDTKETVPIEELIKEPFILTETGAAYRYELEQMLAEMNLQIQPILEIGNTETIINLLKRGMGYSYLPKFTVYNELKSGVLTQVKTNLVDVKMSHQLIYYKNKWITKQMEVFINLTQKYFEERKF